MIRSKARVIEAMMIVADDWRLLKETTIPVKQLKQLRLDTRYQRERVGPKTWELAQLLQAGGDIPDPVILSQRADGGLYIVNGQQRWGAHLLADRPLRARVYRFKDWHAEARYFHGYNNSAPITAAHTASTWQGPSGEIISMLNTSPKSALQGDIARKSDGRIPASTLVKSYFAAMGGKNCDWQLKRVMAELDTLVSQNRERAEKAALNFAALVRQVWGDKRVRSLFPRALGVRCFEEWSGLSVRDTWGTPNKKEMAALRRLALDDKLVPSQEQRHLRFVLHEINEAWPCRRTDKKRAERAA